MEELHTVLRDYGLTVANLPEKGRCLSTTKNFYPGEVIIREEPYVYVPSNSSSEWRCDGCFAACNLKKCSGCQVVWYCGSTCQKMEWKLHRLECSVLAKLDKDKRKSVTSSIRLMLRLYLRQKLQEDKIVSTSATDNYRLVEALVSHMKDLGEKQLVLYAQMANLVNLILQWPDIKIKEVAENFSKLACNAHTICDSELRPIGTGLYPVVSIINHSCLPNAVLVFDGRSAVVRAVQHISEGSEVFISYIDTAGSTMTRQKALREQYFFTCACPRCVKMGQYEDIQESAILEGYRCKVDRCDGFLLRNSENQGFICQKCGNLRSKEEVKDLATQIKASSDEATKLTSSGSCQEAISIYKKIEKLQIKVYHPSSVCLMQTRDKLIKLLMEIEDWREALAYCRLTIPVYQTEPGSYKNYSLLVAVEARKVSSHRNTKSSAQRYEFLANQRAYPEFHPLLGLQYYTCGKLEWLLGETENAIKSLTKASDILRITHGTNTSIVKELLLKLEEARAEASYNKISSVDD